MIKEKRVRKYCRDDISKIENYEEAIADTTQTWDLHHRLELTLDGEFALTVAQLKMHDMYYNRPYYELIFLTKAEHHKLHNMNRSEDTRRKMSESLKGKNTWSKGKTLSDDTKLKMSEAKKGQNNPLFGTHHSDETRRKMSEAKKGKPGFWKGKHLSEETKKKLSEAQKSRWQ